MPPRIVTREILDHLPQDDPEALRSRRDLRRINFLMGNERWICAVMREFPAARKKGIVEIGAGDGRLVTKLAAAFPDAEISACDLASPPADLPPRVAWHRGDIFEIAPPSGGVLIANLFLHHFEAAALAKLGQLTEHFEVLIFNEPDRARLPHVLGALMHPFINRVTRHDMHVSIRAGFADGEIARFLDLDPRRWQIRETSPWRGSRRVVASRH